MMRHTEANFRNTLLLSGGDVIHNFLTSGPSELAVNCSFVVDEVESVYVQFARCMMYSANSAGRAGHLEYVESPLVEASYIL